MKQEGKERVRGRGVGRGKRGMWKRGEGEDEGVDAPECSQYRLDNGPSCWPSDGPTGWANSAPVCTFCTGPMTAAIIGPISYAWLAVRWPNESGQLG